MPLRLAIAMLLFGFVVPVADAAVKVPAKQFHGQCWYGDPRGSAFAWPFWVIGDTENDAWRREHGGQDKPGGAPKCRVTGNGLRDTTPSTKQIETGKNKDDSPKWTIRALDGMGRWWPIADSNGRVFTQLRGNADGTWTVRLPDGTEKALPNPAMAIKGRICVGWASDSTIKRGDRSRYVNVRFGPRADAGEDLSVGGLIDSRALPSRLSRRITAKTGCGSPRAGKRKPAVPVGDFTGLAEDAREPTYVSENSGGAAAGEPVRNYHSTAFGVVAVAVSTTAVDGGGYVRGVVPFATPFEEVDRFGYADPNHGCGSPDGVTWAYGRLVLANKQALWGWVPQYTAVTPPPC
jgi:hypothetical protein